MPYLAVENVKDANFSVNHKFIRALTCEYEFMIKRDDAKKGGSFEADLKTTSLTKVKKDVALPNGKTIEEIQFPKIVNDLPEDVTAWLGKRKGEDAGVLLIFCTFF